MNEPISLKSWVNQKKESDAQGRLQRSFLRISEVAGTTGEQAVAERLREMGLYSGVQIEFVRQMPFGGPIVIRTKDVDIALRSEEAACVLISI